MRLAAAVLALEERLREVRELLSRGALPDAEPASLPLPFGSWLWTAVATPKIRKRSPALNVASSFIVVASM